MSIVALEDVCEVVLVLVLAFALVLVVLIRLCVHVPIRSTGEP